MRVGWLRSLEHAWPVSVGGSHDDDYGSKLGIALVADLLLNWKVDKKSNQPKDKFFREPSLFVALPF